MSENILNITDKEFENVVKNSKVPVLVDFWAEWCGPCRMIAPTLEQLADEYDSKVQIVKINIDENQATPAQFNVRGIPTLIMFKGGNQVETRVGAASRSELAELIEKHT